jgi:hypothetical protein
VGVVVVVAPVVVVAGLVVEVVDEVPVRSPYWMPRPLVPT